MGMDVEEKLALLKKPPTIEILTEEELRNILSSGEELVHYQGFEISGFVHLGTGLLSCAKIADFQKIGVKTTLFLADWHSWINNKLGGDLDLIRKLAKDYFAEAMKLTLEVMGGKPEKLEVILGSEIYDEDYWAIVLDVAKHTTLARVRRSITIMGRKLGEAIDFSMLIYPVMQVADIFKLGINLVHAGIDQRKAHVIARHVGPKLRFCKAYKPIALHHELLLGLWFDQATYEAMKRADESERKELMMEVKMSKSKPKTCVFVHDSPEEIREKIRQAFCPAGETELNPVLQIARVLIFREEEEFEIEREQKYGGPITYSSFEELERDFVKRELHPLDLKNAVAEWLIRKLEPVRKAFSKGKRKKALEEMKLARITR